MPSTLNKADHPADTRVLLCEPRYLSSPFEVTVIEWTPDGKLVKVCQMTSENKEYYRWMTVRDIENSEVLAVLPKSKNPFEIDARRAFQPFIDLLSDFR